MDGLFQRTGERRLIRAGNLFRKGRARVVWVNGVLWFGGSLFVLYNVIDFCFEPAARATRIQLLGFFAALAGSMLAGYWYGSILWRQLERTFGDR